MDTNPMSCHGASTFQSTPCPAGYDVMVVSGSTGQPGAPSGGSGAPVIGCDETAKVTTRVDRDWQGSRVPQLGGRAAVIRDCEEGSDDRGGATLAGTEAVIGASYRVLGQNACHNHHGGRSSINPGRDEPETPGERELYGKIWVALVVDSRDPQRIGRVGVSKRNQREETAKKHRDDAEST